MVAMIGRHYDVGNRLIGHLGDMVDHALRFVDVTLAVGDEDARIGYDEQADRSELLLSG